MLARSTFPLLPMAVLLAFSFPLKGLCQKKLFKKVPSSASLLFVVDGKNLAEKVDFDQIRALEFYKDLDEKTAANLKEKYEYVSYLYKDPAKAGLDLESKMYAYWDFQDIAEGKFDFLLLIPLSSKGRFEDFLNNIVDSSVLGQKVKCGKASYFVNDGMIFGYTGQYCFLTPASSDFYNTENRKEKAEVKVKALVRRKSSKSILKDQNFRTFLKEDFDAGYWINSGGLINYFFNSVLASGELNSFLQNKELFRDTYLQLFLNFNKGDITYHTKQYLTPALAGELSTVYASKFDETILNYFRKGNLLGSMAYSINVPEFRTYWEKNFSDLQEFITDKAAGDFYENAIEQDTAVLKIENEINDLSEQIDDLQIQMYEYEYDYDDYGNYEDTEEYGTYEENDYEEYEDYEEYPEQEQEEVTEEEVEIVFEEPAPSPVEEDEDMSEDTEEYEIATDTVTIVEESLEEYEEFVSPEDELLLDSLKTLREKKREELKKRKEAVIEEKKAAFPYTKDDLWSLFEGDIIAAITDIRYEEKIFKSYEYDEQTEEFREVEKTRREPVPVFIIASSIGSSELALRVLSDIEKKGLIKKEGDYYLIIPGNDKMYLFLEGNTLVFTNNENLITTYRKGYAQTELLDPRVRSLILDNNFSMYIDFKEIMARFPKESFDAEESFTVFTNIMGALQNISAMETYGGESVISGKVQINLTNKIDNSLFEIFRVANVIYLQFRPKF